MSARDRESRRVRGIASCVALACLLVTLASVWIPKGAFSQEHNFAGSLQTNYLGVVTDKNAFKQTFDGFTNELSLKVAVDFNDNVSANVKLCYGCHGVELGMAFADLRVIDELNFRVGRFTPAFGDFPLRHDPANHRTSDKPLPYDMGRMIRQRDFNFGILPAPYVDQGIEISGTHWFGDDVQFDYAVHAVGGLRQSEADLDLNFMQSRSVYYVDNNSEPAVGGRLALTVDISEDVLFTIGGSMMAGRSDPARELTYAIVGADLYLRLGEFDLHAEYLLRRQEFALGDDPDSKFRYGPNKNGEYDNFFLKDGFYVEGTMPVSSRLEVVGRVDGLRRMGNVTLNSPLRRRSGVLRYTAGLNVVLDGSVRLKFSGELYDFTDFEDEVALNAGVAAAF
jgi:hypothetical protein